MTVGSRMAGITPEQKAALEKAEHDIRPAMELYELRNYIAHRVYALDLDRLKRLSSSIRYIDDAALSELVDFAEGLAVAAGMDPVCADESTTTPR